MILFFLVFQDRDQSQYSKNCKPDIIGDGLRIHHQQAADQQKHADKRIDFVGGIRGLKELERRVREGMAAAFSMYPTSMEELLAVADAGRLMPPKSTWFEPKLRSGLFIHRLS